MLHFVAGLMLAVVVAVAAMNALVLVSGGSHIVSESEAATYDADCILVLGASVFADGTPSQILQDRLDEAVQLYFAGVAPKIIVSGDNGTDSYNEVTAMKNYVVSCGVPSSDVFGDRAGFCTYDSMYRAKNVFGVSRMVVVTQTYHLYRALYIANGLGMSAVGVGSDARAYDKQLFYDVREIPARVKAVLQTALAVPSAQLDDPVSLNGSGDDADAAAQA